METLNKSVEFYIETQRHFWEITFLLTQSAMQRAGHVSAKDKNVVGNQYR